MEYCKMKVYEKSYRAALAIYKMTERFPKEEIYGITSQLRRAALSIPLNIAEGYAKKDSQAEFKRFVSMALGSSDECQVLLNFVKDLGYIEEEMYQKAKAEYEETSKMLNKLKQSI